MDPASDCKEMDHREEVDGILFEAGRQSPHVFDPAEEAFDDVARSIEIGFAFNRLPWR